MTISVAQACYVYGQLVDAYYGVNHYNKTEARIYAHWLMPMWANGTKDIDETTKLNAAQALVDLVTVFHNNYDAKINISGIGPTQWLKTQALSFDHAVIITIYKKGK